MPVATYPTDRRALAQLGIHRVGSFCPNGLRRLFDYSLPIPTYFVLFGLIRGQLYRHDGNQ